jgi:hypothetical protein
MAMLSQRRSITNNIFILIGLILGLGCLAYHFPVTGAGAADINISKESIDTLSKVNAAMAEITSAVKPAIVNISSTKAVAARSVPSPFFNDPFFRDFFGDQFR